MTEEPKKKKPFSEPVKLLVANASDEQLAWMVGPDRRFYSKEALEAASLELEVRREQDAGRAPEPASFDVAAFAFGPLWYFYHGMLGRGVLILLVFTGALFGLQPVADAVGIPAMIWIVAVILVVASYCGRYGARDLAESKAQARLTARKKKARELTRRSQHDDHHEPAGGSELVQVAEVGCRLAGEQAKALLETEGIRAMIKCEDTGVFGPGSGSVTRSVFPATIHVARESLDRSRELLTVLLRTFEEEPTKGCPDEESAKVDS